MVCIGIDNWLLCVDCEYSCTPVCPMEGNTKSVLDKMDKTLKKKKKKKSDASK